MGDEIIEPTEETTDVVIARGVAQVIDYAAYFAVGVVVLFLLVLAVDPARDAAWVTIPVFLSFLAYNTLFEVYWNGQTVGKRITGIKVVNEEGTDPSLRAGLIRNVPAAVPAAWIPGAVAALFAISSTDLRQRNFDIFADTYVVVADGQLSSDRRPDDSDSNPYEVQNFGSS